MLIQIEKWAAFVYEDMSCDIRPEQGKCMLEGFIFTITREPRIHQSHLDQSEAYDIS